MSESYKRAPIIEAVIEFRSSTPISHNLIEKLRVRLKSRFPKEEEINTYNVNLDFINGSATIDTTSIGYKMSSEDGLDIRVISNNSITISRLAPYPGWELFEARGRDDLTAWKKQILGTKILSRIGVRFINRIDIPIQPVGQVELDDYFNVGVKAPQPPLGPLAEFSSHVGGPIGEGGDACMANLNYLAVESPLVAHSSFILDIDVYRDGGVPATDEAIWELVARMRDHKNSLFEAAVTDRSRDLFR